MASIWASHDRLSLIVTPSNLVFCNFSISCPPICRRWMWFVDRAKFIIISFVFCAFIFILFSSHHNTISSADSWSLSGVTPLLHISMSVVSSKGGFQISDYSFEVSSTRLGPLWCSSCWRLPCGYMITDLNPLLSITQEVMFPVRIKDGTSPSSHLSSSIPCSIWLKALLKSTSSILTYCLGNLLPCTSCGVGQSGNVWCMSPSHFRTGAHHRCRGISPPTTCR